MSGPEAEFKSRLVKAVREDGGYARRLEDQFAVGLPDMYIALKGARRPLFAEAKIVRGAWFGPTPRQLHELKLINTLEFHAAIVIGYDPTTRVCYYGAPAEKLLCAECAQASTIPSLLSKLKLL